MNSTSDPEIHQLMSQMELAMAALQLSPTPQLVLTSAKTVWMVNEAMARLLRFGSSNITKDIPSGENDANSDDYTNTCRGKSFFEMGIDLSQNGQTSWLSWADFFESLDREIKLEIAQTSRYCSSPLKRITKIRQIVPAVAVDITVSRDRSTTSNIKHITSSGYREPVTMAISEWSLEHKTYFTLSFTPSPLVLFNHIPSQHMEALNISLVSSTSKLDISDPTSFACDKNSYQEPESLSAAARSSSRALLFPAQTEKKTRAGENCAVSLRIAQIIDAALNASDSPILALRQDGSFITANRPAKELMVAPFDPISRPDQRFEDCFECLDDSDFESIISVDDFPIYELCYNGKPFRDWKIGIIHPKSQKRLSFNVVGKCVYDVTGELLAAIVILRDRTIYMEEKERQFQLLCGTMPQMVWTSQPDGQYDYFSPRWCESTGLSLDETLKLRWNLPFHETDMPEIMKRWQHSIATGEGFNMEYRCRRHDGAWRWMLGQSLPYRDRKTGQIIKWFGTSTDIHDLVEARTTAKRVREQLVTVIKHSQVTLWVTDRYRKLTFLEGKDPWNEEDYSSSGLGKDVVEVLGKHAIIEDLSRYTESIDGILNGTTSMEIFEHHVSDTNRWYRTRFVPILEKKGDTGAMNDKVIDGIIGISMDVTDLRRQEQENVALMANETAAIEANQLKSQFLANTSHEIRTPISGVIGMADLLVDTTLTEDQHELVENIQLSASSLLTVINDILDFSKVEAGKLELENVPFRLPVVVDAVVRMLSFAARRKGLEFLSHVKLENCPELLGDPGRIRQILTNIITNGIKFTTKGHVELAVRIQNETDETCEVSFTVRDTGIGIGDEVKKQLFLPFSQADASTARRYGGTGLGLAICKSLLDLMKGDIEYSSSIGIGTRATFWIPFNKIQDSTKGKFLGAAAPSERLQLEPSLLALPIEHGVSLGEISHRRNPLGSADRNLVVSSSESSLAANYPLVLTASERSQIQVLVVEDNAINQKIARRTIEKLGFPVETVWNGQEALDYLLNLSPSSPKLNIILMDVQMPVLNGYDTTHTLRLKPPYSTRADLQAIPIIALTASAIQGDREKCIAAGMDDYLTKPVKSPILEKMLVKWGVEVRKRSIG
ncbi:MAG: hypothetical protein M1834_005710 [Cirrosporium novae-zelandiae]|nr:MAG: hypothetical protein M1834_005710 [Cirrosporium novae-zelandiae]